MSDTLIFSASVTIFIQEYLRNGRRNIVEHYKRAKCFQICMVLFCAGLSFVYGYPFPANDMRYLDRDYASPGAHQLASFLVSQLRPKEYVAPIETPIIPYRLPLQGKRNSEVTNAIIGSEETQKLYREGRK